MRLSEFLEGLKDPWINGEYCLEGHTRMKFTEADPDIIEELFPRFLSAKVYCSDKSWVRTYGMWGHFVVYVPDARLYLRIRREELGNFYLNEFEKAVKE